MANTGKGRLVQAQQVLKYHYKGLNDDHRAYDDPLPHRSRGSAITLWGMTGIDYALTPVLCMISDSFSEKRLLVSKHLRISSLLYDIASV